MLYNSFKKGRDDNELELDDEASEIDAQKETASATLMGKNWFFKNLDRGDERWAKNKSYFRLDGKTGLSREDGEQIQFQFESFVFPHVHQ